MYSHKAAAEDSAPPPAAGRSKYSDPKARARHAALVRWKKENPQAANLQERLAQIRAARLKKAKGGGKGKGKAKGGAGKKPAAPKLTPEQRKAAQAQAQAAAREKTLKETGLAEDARASLDDLIAGRDVEDDGGLEKMGLAERGKDGKLRLTSAGRAVHRAAGRGDTGAVKDALSRAKEKAAKPKAAPKAQASGREKRDASRQERRAKAKQKLQRALETTRPQPQPEHKMIANILTDLEAIRDELMDDADAAIKAGRRNAAPDQANIDRGYEMAMELCDLFESLGADTGEEEGEGEMGDMEGKAIADDPVAYAYQECGGIQQASAALSQIAQLAAMEAGEQDDDTPMILSKLRQAMQLLTDYISGEVAEIKAIAKREDVNPKAGVSAYGDVTFADEKNKKYPLDTEAHIRSAWSYIGQERNASQYSPEDVAAIKKKIVAAWKDKIDKAGPPSAETKKSLDYTHDGDAVKALADGRIGAYAVRFGSEDEPDMSPMKDYFTKATDYWLDAWDRRPMLFHHAMDEDTEDAPRIGTWTKAEIKDEGVWLEGQLDKHHRYYGAIKELVRRGVLRLSSDSAPHLVRRAAKAGGIHEVTRWPLLAASLTPTPAEPRLQAASFKALLAELGINDTDNQEADEAAERERLDAAKALQDRRRRLLLDIDLLTLEATIT